MVERLKAIASEEANIRFYNLTKQGLENSWAINDSTIMERPGGIILKNDSMTCSVCDFANDTQMNNEAFDMYA